MSIIARIASLELRGLFYSPVAWLVLVIFTILPALRFTGLLGMSQTSQYIGDKLEDLTWNIFANPFGGFFVAMQSELYLYIPLLTMGLVSRELSSGSIKLLYSSPIKVAQIVLGKFLALMGFALVLIAILAAFVIAGWLSIDSLDVGLTISGLLGLYLLICAYAAIGLFMSCLTSYQVVAAVSTLLALAVLSFIGSIGQQYDFVRDLTYFLSISGRSLQFINGMISSKDVAYFLIVTAMFLGLSIVKLQSGRESSRFIVNTMRYAAVVSAALLLGYVTSRPALWGFYDMSATKRNTLTAASQAVMARMTQPLQITTYGNLLDAFIWYALPTNRNNDFQQFEAYVRFKPDIRTDYVYYYDTSKNDGLYKSHPGLSDRQLAKIMAASVGHDLTRYLAPNEIRKRIDLTPEENRLVRRLEYGDKHSFLRMFYDNDIYPGESETTAALKRLISTPPKVAFLTGHEERRLDRLADGDYRSVTRELTYRYSLINQGFDVATLDLKNSSVPDDVTVLVIAAPKQALGAQASRVRDYIDRGGNALIAADPGDQAILNPLLEPLGVQFMPERLVQENKDQASDFVLGKLADSAIRRVSADAGLFEERTKVIVNGYGKDLFKVKTVSLPGAVGIRYDDGGPFTVRTVIVAPVKTGDSKLIPVALGLTRQTQGKEQRLMVVGDADFMSNRELARENMEAANLAFAMETFKWLSHGELPVDTNRPTPKDDTVLVDRNGILMWKVLFSAILPALTASFGAALLILRRRR